MWVRSLCCCAIQKRNNPILSKCGDLYHRTYFSTGPCHHLISLRPLERYMNKQDTSAEKASTSRAIPVDSIDDKQHIVVRRTTGPSHEYSNDRVVHWDQHKLNVFMHAEHSLYSNPQFRHLSVFPGGYIYIETKTSTPG